MAECHKRDCCLSLAPFRYLGCAGRSLVGSSVCDVGLYLQRPRPVHIADYGQPRLGYSCVCSRDHSWLETIPIFSPSGSSDRVEDDWSMRPRISACFEHKKVSLKSPVANNNA